MRLNITPLFNDWVVLACIIPNVLCLSQSNSVFQDIEKLAIKTAEKLEAEFWAVSSRTGENVDEMFRRMAALMFDRQMMNQKKPEHQTVSTDGFSKYYST